MTVPAEFRNRWKSPEGMALRDALVRAWRARDQGWPSLLPESQRAKGLDQKDDLRGIILDGLDLSEADMSHADLSWASVRNCRMRSVVLQGAIAVGADFSFSSMGAADMLEICAVRSQFVGTDLGAAILMAGS